MIRSMSLALVTWLALATSVTACKWDSMTEFKEREFKSDYNQRPAPTSKQAEPEVSSTVISLGSLVTAGTLMAAATLISLHRPAR